MGVSTYRAYEFLKGRESKTVIVAILDNGAEFTHEDLQGQYWINEDEISGNGIDDDNNGYIDDIHGWNFLGNQKGENIKRETTELTRIFARLREKYASRGLSVLNKEDSLEYVYYQDIKDTYEKEIQKKNDDIRFYKFLIANYKSAFTLLTEYFGHSNFNMDSILSVNSTNTSLAAAKKFMLGAIELKFDDKSLEGIVKNMEQDFETRLNPFFNVREEIVGDDPADLSDSIYGNNMVNAMSPYHGTGVAGTVAALWNESKVSGIVKNVKLMILRVLPNGDERDKDVALAIKYAVRNGADIINCSFGKMYSSHPEFVQHAIKEAERAGVLIVHAAGNDSKNNDSIPTYPTGCYQDGSRAKNWLSVGATGMRENEMMIAQFSNYGKSTVDVFAPGVDIKSCALGSKYDWASGTSTAAPVVAGIAAVLKSYFPKLKAEWLKEIIIQSVYKPKIKQVYLPSTKRFVSFENLSVSGGIVNLYKAILLAESKYAD
ncbi:MAG: S8 family serine peptidase [Chloroflexia bacterium]|nr:S8 family serine peptidase [Chloroflexia bacterium]